jgi:uncharacterized membrane protein
MTMRKGTLLSVAGALAGAIALATSAQAQPKPPGAGQVKCYGVAMSGKNDCANAAATHSCAGQASANYDGGDWKAAKADDCTGMGGMLEPFKGKNPKKA